jgi:predicted phage terminase large subunit-like protein
MDWSILRRARPIVAEHLASDLAAFTRAAWSVLHPGAKLSWSWHMDLLCEYLTFVRRREITRLIINVPPRTAKSTVASICFPVWSWISDPASAFLCASYELDLASSHNLDRRRLITSSWFQSLFADRFRLASDRNLIEEFTNESGGAMLAASVNSRAMGRGGDYCIVDDPISATDVFSDVLRRQACDWFQTMLPQRLNDPATSPIVVIMQRVHEADPTGFLLETEPGEWTHVKLPLVAEENERWIFPLSGRVVERRKGEVIDPRRFPRRVVEARKRNRLAWAGQYQQEPAPVEGNLIRVSDVCFYGGRDSQTGLRDAACPESFDQKIVSVDAAFKDKPTSDYVSILTIGVKGSRRYVLNVVNAHLDLDATEQAILREQALHGPISATLIEDKANGPAIIAHLKEHVSGVIALNPEGGKLARMVAAAPEWQARDWFLDRTAAWKEPLLQQLTMFPNARHDDMCDAISQAAIWLQANTHVYGWLDYLKGITSGLIRYPDEPKIDPKNPRTDNLHRNEMFELEKELRGLKETSGENREAGAEPKTPVCERCGATCTIRLNQGVHCNQCGFDFYPTGCSAPEITYATRDGLVARRKQ